MDLKWSKRNLLRPVEDTVTSFVWRDVIMRGMSVIAGHRPQNQAFDLLCTENTRFFFPVYSLIAGLIPHLLQLQVHVTLASLR